MSFLSLRMKFHLFAKEFNAKHEEHEQANQPAKRQKQQVKTFFKSYMLGLTKMIFSYWLLLPPTPSMVSVFLFRETEAVRRVEGSYVFGGIFFNHHFSPQLSAKKVPLFVFASDSDCVHWLGLIDVRKVGGPGVKISLSNLFNYFFVSGDSKQKNFPQKKWYFDTF